MFMSSWDCQWKFYSTTCNSDQKLNNGKCQCEYKKYCTYKKEYFFVGIVF